MKGLNDRVVVVTGGAGGIGASICRRLSQEGARIAILDLNLKGAKELSEELSHSGNPSAAYKVDISDYAQVESAIEDVELKLGPIDVQVNNAGWDHAARFVDTSP
jgi:2-hydroxycyclohexanecarboxyl-CoA dehydrogenase